MGVIDVVSVVSGLKERVDRLQCDCSLRNAFKSGIIFVVVVVLSLYYKGQELFVVSASFISLQGWWVGPHQRQ